MQKPKSIFAHLHRARPAGRAGGGDCVHGRHRGARLGAVLQLRRTSAATAPRGGGGGGGWFGGDFFAPFQQQAPKRVIQDFSRAPAPEKKPDPNFLPERNILVLGDGMADWLAYGLEDAYGERPDMGVIRKHRTASGLIKYQPKGEPADWTAAAKGILATEKPDAIVVMLGINDRVAMREPVAEKKDDKKKDDKKDARKPDAKPGDKPAAKPEGGADTAAKPDDKPADAEADDADAADAPSITAPEKSARGGSLHEFREERWVELYAKKIEELIGVLKVQGRAGAVGRPARDPRRQGHVRHAVPGLAVSRRRRQGRHHLCRRLGRLCRRSRPLPAKGPRLRRPDPPAAQRYDGVYFTKPGARKLAHYVDREITRLLAARSGPIALPSEPATPDPNAAPGQPAPRPMAGPILPLVASSVGTDQLLGGPGSRPASVDALAARTLVKGESLAPPAGRADDFVWPRREVGREQAKGDTPVANVAPDGRRRNGR